MKKVVMLLLTAFVLTSCINITETHSDKPVKEENRQIPAFERIRLLGSPTVYYTQADSVSLRVEAPEDLLELVETEVHDGVLTVQLRDGAQDIIRLKRLISGDDVSIFVTSPDLIDVQLVGSGDFKCDSHLDTDNLNVELQRALNPKGDSITRGGTTFRVGDRVMQLRNSYDRDVFNGDVGFVKSVDPAARAMVVTFDGRPVKYDSGDLDELVLAYAMTIHKSQGSEYPAVIVIMHTQHYVMLQRNLLYTAITRGRRLVLLMGVPYAVDQAIKTNTVRERRTGLAERLAQDGHTKG